MYFYAGFLPKPSPPHVGRPRASMIDGHSYLAAIFNYYCFSSIQMSPLLTTVANKHYLALLQDFCRGDTNLSKILMITLVYKSQTNFGMVTSQN